MSKLIDITGQDFGYWHVIERAPNRAGGRAYWKCKCTACGTEKEVASSHLRSGRSTNCGCIRMEKMRQASIKHEEGKTYGYLYVQREATPEEKPRNDRTGVYWNCDCLHCGRKNVIVFGDYLRNGDTTSCGCIVSKNESRIADMLTNANIQFKEQYTFDNLRNGATNLFHFDFAIFNQNNLLYLIEYDGFQHFKATKSGWSNEDKIQITHENDLTKNDYCFKNNIPLIRIPYDIEYELSDLRLETTRFLLTQENEDKYYERMRFKAE